MNVKQFSDALSNVNDKYIEEAATASAAADGEETFAQAGEAADVTTKEDAGTFAGKEVSEISGAVTDAVADETAGEIKTISIGEVKKSERRKKKMSDVERSKNKEKSTGSQRGLKVWRAIAIAACAVLAVSGTLAVFLSVGMGSGSSADMTMEYETVASSNGSYYGVSAAKGSGSDYGYEAAEEGIYEDSVSMYDNSSQRTDAKIIYSASIEMQSKDFDGSAAGITALVEKYGAYFESKDVYNYSGDYRSAYYLIRIPVEHYKDFISESAGVANVTSINESAEDVSEDYYDTDTRLETAKTKLKRLQELLAEASKMEDIITIETEISSTEYEIDSLQGTLNRYDSLIEYSTISIQLNEVYEVTVTEAPKTFGEKVSIAFETGLKGFGDAMSDLAIWFAASWLWILFVLAIIAIIVAIIVVIVKKAGRKA